MIDLTSLSAIPPAALSQPDAPAAPENSPAVDITPSEIARIRAASHDGANAAAQLELASDEAVMVRAALAINPSATPATDEAIARDPDDRVRTLLAQRLARLLPSLSDDHLSRLQNRAVATLMALAADKAERVRAAIAEIVKDLPAAPRALVLHLAHDAAASVAEPVIRLSPLLTNDDLLALVAAPPGALTVTAVARRPGLAAQVADAIARSPDATAIAALLENPTAAISEATLDTLIVGAAEHTSWQLPLVRRDRLSQSALMTLAALVSGNILSQLAARPDLPTELAARLRERLAPALARLTSGTALRGPSEFTSGQPFAAPNLSDAFRLAEQMAQAHTLTEEAMLAAARRGEARLCSAMLAVAAKVAAPVVERAITLRSAKGVLSLVWRAGFSMRVAGPLQTLLVRLPPEALLRPSDTGDFPLSEREMRWQIEFLTRIGRTEYQEGWVTPG